MVIKRGDMFYADLSPVIGSEQGGITTVIAAAITSQTGKNKLPTHIEIGSDRKWFKIGFGCSCRTNTHNR